MYEKWIELRNEVIFETNAGNFTEVCARACNRLAAQGSYRLLADITMDIRSYLLRYVQGNEAGLLDGAAKAQAEANLCVLEQQGQEKLAQEVKEQIDSFGRSNLIELTALADAGKLNVHWGNDNGLGIMQAMQRGAVLCTTNPPIVNMARKDEPAYFDAVRDNIVAEYSHETPERRVSRLTMEVVLSNCRALRPIYERSGHKLGYANYQVNPRNYQDAAAMAAEIRFAYAEMEKALGGKPNVAFKVPGTKAALDTVEDVAKDGVCVTITVNFSAAQSMEFAKRIQAGCAEQSYVVMMSGRLDGPVAEELEAAGVENAQTVARGASRAVTYAMYHDVLLGNGFDKTEILVASLRGPWNFSASLTEDPRSHVAISSFPDKSEAFDVETRDFTPLLQHPVSQEELKVLSKSAIFQKAYAVDGMRPEEFDAYAPVAATLSQFIGVYDELVSYMS